MTTIQPYNEHDDDTARDQHQPQRDRPLQTQLSSRDIMLWGRTHDTVNDLLQGNFVQCTELFVDYHTVVRLLCVKTYICGSSATVCWRGICPQIGSALFLRYKTQNLEEIANIFITCTWFRFCMWWWMVLLSTEVSSNECSSRRAAIPSPTRPTVESLLPILWNGSKGYYSLYIGEWQHRWKGQ